MTKIILLPVLNRILTELEDHDDNGLDISLAQSMLCAIEKNSYCTDEFLDLSRDLLKWMKVWDKADLNYQEFHDSIDKKYKRLSIKITESVESDNDPSLPAERLFFSIFMWLASRRHSIEFKGIRKIYRIKLKDIAKEIRHVIAINDIGVLVWEEQGAHFKKLASDLQEKYKTISNMEVIWQARQTKRYLKKNPHLLKFLSQPEEFMKLSFEENE